MENMQKLTKVVSEQKHYTVEVTGTQVVEAQKSNKHFEELLKLVGDDMKLTKSIPNKIEYIIE
tara:strand:+ start:592 stop:780 length:189 start_codon:yes stop_codon:yes gene_type:complete